MRRVRSILGQALLLGMAALVVVRIGQLALQPRILTARNERRFFDWAYGAVGLALQGELPRVAGSLADGEVICFAGEPVDPSGQPPRDPISRLVLADYFLSRQIVVVPPVASGGRGPACGRTLLLASPHSPLRLLRLPDAASRR